MSSPIVVGVALREDDAAPIALGRDLAALTDAALALVHAYPYEQPSAVPGPVRVSELRTRSIAALERLADPLRDKVEGTARAGTGASPAAVLHDAAAALQAPLIVVGSTHRGRVGRVMPGSVTARLLQGSDRAVAVVPRGYVGAAIRRIGAAFVDTPEGRDALAAATVAARLCGGTVRAFTVHDAAPPASAFAVPGWGGLEAVEEARRDRDAAAAERARELIPPDVLDGVEVLAGHPGDALIEVSKELDLLVCGSRGFGPLHAVVRGGVSRALVDGAACPVLVVPHGAGGRIERLVRGRASVEG
jgi:nucleotide-binding universal stress UspA family protein